MRPLRLAIVGTHPVQYYAPVFRALARMPQLHPRVFYTWSQSEQGLIADAGFGQAIRWDLPLLSGYESEFVPNVARLPGPERFDGVRTPALVTRIEEFQADAVLVYGWNLQAHFAAMRALHGRIPVYFRGDSTLLDPLPAAKRWLRRLSLTAVYRFIDVAIAVGANNRDYFRWCGKRPDDIELAPHSVDVARFAADDASRSAEARRRRAELGIPSEATVFGFAGKFLPKKDPLLLIDALLAARPGAHLLLFGAGVLEPEIRARASTHGSIHVLPFQNQTEMPIAYRMCNVFVLPSRGPGETWGLALNEAMACGRAVIASDRVGGARDLVVPGETGWVFPAADRVALTQLFDQIQAMSPARLRATGERARQWVQRWSTEESAARIAEIVTRRTAGFTHGVGAAAPATG